MVALAGYAIEMVRYIAPYNLLFFVVIILKQFLVKNQYFLLKADFCYKIPVTNSNFNAFYIQGERFAHGGSRIEPGLETNNGQTAAKRIEGARHGRY